MDAYSVNLIERSELLHNLLMVSAKDLQYWCTELH